MRILSLALLASLLLAVTAAAGPSPSLYFLQDGSAGPLGDGRMNATAPDSLEPSTRPIVAGTSDLPSAVFIGPDAPQDRLYGPLFAAVWLGPSAVADGNLTGAVYIEDADGTRTLLATASQSVITNASSVDPMTLVPPDPTDPEAAAAHVLGQAMAQTLQPPVVLDLGHVDAQVPEGGSISIGLYLEAGDSGSPLPAGAASAQYDGQMQPSFVWVPWYAPDPPPPSPNPSASPSGSASDISSGPSSDSPSPGSGDDSGEGPAKDTPAIGLLPVLGLLGAALYGVRRGR